MAHGQGNAEVCENKSPTLNCNHEAPIICCESGQGYWKEDKVSGPVKTNGAEPTTVLCYDARGNGEGDIVPNLTGDHASRPNDYMPVVLEQQSCFNVTFCDANGRRKDRPNGGCYVNKADASKTISGNGQNETLICFVKNDAARDYSKDVAMTLRGQAEHAVSYQSTVRRLMPIECERLMGFPDNHTQIEWNGKPKEQCPDSPRYKACGNSFPVNSVRWLGMRIQMIEKLTQKMENKKCQKTK
jgi:DNA (cytosine-5)-methyltransferase 1